MNWAAVRPVLATLLAALLCLGLVVSGVDRWMLPPSTVEQFEAFGYPLWFARVVGSLEIVGGVLLLFRRTTAVAATLLGLLLLGAISSHLISGYGSVLHALRTLVLVGLVMWLRGRGTAGDPIAGPPAEGPEPPNIPTGPHSH